MKFSFALGSSGASVMGMRARPTWVFVTMATLLVGWLSLRMWSGDSVPVWQVSVVLAAFAPFAAAAVFRYIVAVADRESRVLVAWLVRAISMHWVLVWMVGVADLLRGMPGSPTGRNWDALAPLVLLGFFPAFGACFGVLRWGESLAKRMTHAVLRPVRPGERHERATAFRGVTLVPEEGSPVRAVRVPALVGALGIAALCAAGREAHPWIAGAAALALASGTLRRPSAHVPSVIALAGLVVEVQARAFEAGAWMHSVMALPWLSLATVALYLGALESGLRVRARAAGVATTAGR